MSDVNRNSNNRKIITALLFISLSFNIVLAYRYNTVNQDPHGYIAYLTILKLDRQSDILKNLSDYFNKLQKNEIAKEEVQAYIKGVEEFLINDILRGAYNYTYDENTEIKNALNSITNSILLSKEILRKTFSTNLSEVSRIYIELSNLIDRNNGESSFSYYLFNNDLNNPKLIDIIDELAKKTSLIEQYTR